MGVVIMYPNHRVNIDQLELQAASYSNLGTIHTIINPAEIGRCIWIHLKPEVCTFSFVRAEEIATKKLVHEGGMERDGIVWIKAFSQELNLDVGYHAYRLVFWDVIHNVEVFQYIAYTIQTPDAPKPYIYMDRQETE